MELCQATASPAARAEFLALLPGFKNLRWFPTSWREAEWAEVLSVPLSEDRSILLAQPFPEAPYLQIPIERTPHGPREASGDLVFWRDWLRACGVTDKLVEATLLGKEQSNTSVVLRFESAEAWVAKLFRVVHPGANPDVALPRGLRQAGFTKTPQVRAELTCEAGGSPYCLGVATDLVENTGTAWDYFSAAAAAGEDTAEDAKTLGRVVGALYLALGQMPADRSADPLAALAARLEAAFASRTTKQHVPPEQLARLQDRVGYLLENAGESQTSRIHGDLHLGQILHTEDGDWQIIDFEGEPLRPLRERNKPDFALRDPAGMLRSFSYAGWDNPDWASAMRQAFMEGFSAAAGGSAAASPVLQLLEIEKALYEVDYEAQFRPDWLHVPLASLGNLLHGTNES